MSWVGIDRGWARMGRLGGGFKECWMVREVRVQSVVRRWEGGWGGLRGKGTKGERGEGSEVDRQGGRNRQNAGIFIRFFEF